MNYQELLNMMFASNLKINERNNIILGEASYAKQNFAICGVVNSASLDNAMCQQLAEFILTRTAENPSINLLVLVDTAGQKTTHFAELIGLNRYFAHLAKTLHFVRSEGARVFGLVYGKALGGALVATALNAEKIYALNTAEIAVMWLDAMSRITKIPLERLQELSKSSAIFAPGAENFVKLGAVAAILTPEQIMPQIHMDLQSPPDAMHQWLINGAKRGGRNMANKVVSDILNA